MLLLVISLKQKLTTLLHSLPVSQQCTVSALRGAAEDQGGVLYSTLHFKPCHAQNEAPTYPRPGSTGKPEVEYAAVNLSRPSAATQ